MSNGLEFQGQGHGVLVSDAVAPSYTKYMIVSAPATRFAPAKAILSRWSPDGWITLKTYTTVADCKTYANGHHAESI